MWNIFGRLSFVAQVIILDKLRTTLREAIKIISFRPTPTLCTTMTITELFAQLVGRSEPLPANPTNGELDIEENEIAEEIEVENEEVNAVCDHLREAIEGKQGKSEIPTNLLAQFDVVQSLSLDAWAATTLRAYKG